MTNYDFVSVPVSTETISRILKFTNELKSEKSLNETIELMIEYGLENAEQKYRDFSHDIFALSATNSTKDGYLWKYDKKTLFLPNNTQLLRKYKGKNYISTLQNGMFIFDNKEFESPAKLAIAMSDNTSVNAWITIYVKRPHDTKWSLAENLANYD